MENRKGKINEILAFAKGEEVKKMYYRMSIDNSDGSEVELLTEYEVFDPKDEMNLLIKIVRTRDDLPDEYKNKI
jgi:hypothetical protein